MPWDISNTSLSRRHSSMSNDRYISDYDLGYNHTKHLGSSGVVNFTRGTIKVTTLFRHTDEFGLVSASSALGQGVD